MLDNEVAALLSDADRTIERLERLCCVPGRSPAMQAIAADLRGVRAAFDGFAGQSNADSIVDQLEETGSRIGRLQVGCCAPVRMPLYADLLVALTELQRAANARVGRAH